MTVIHRVLKNACKSRYISSKGVLLDRLHIYLVPEVRELLESLVAASELRLSEYVSSLVIAEEKRLETLTELA